MDNDQQPLQQCPSNRSMNTTNSNHTTTNPTNHNNSNSNRNSSSRRGVGVGAGATAAVVVVGHRSSLRSSCSATNLLRMSQRLGLIVGSSTTKSNDNDDNNENKKVTNHHNNEDDNSGIGNGNNNNNNNNNGEAELHDLDDDGESNYSGTNVEDYFQKKYNNKNQKNKNHRIIHPMSFVWNHKSKKRNQHNPTNNNTTTTTNLNNRIRRRRSRMNPNDNGTTNTTGTTGTSYTTNHTKNIHHNSKSRTGNCFTGGGGGQNVIGPDMNEEQQLYDSKNKKQNQNHNNTNQKSSNDYVDHHDNKNDDFLIASGETIAVHRLKYIFIILLFLVGIAASLTVYVYIKKKEKNELSIQFTYVANQIISKLQINALTKIEAISGLATQIQAYSIYTNSTWPNVTLPFFEEQVLATKTLTDAYAVQLFPIVSEKNRKGWEQYSIENNQWINESYTTQRILFNKSESSTLLESDVDTWFDLLWGEEYRNPDMPNFEIGNGMSSTIFSSRNVTNASITHIHIEKQQQKQNDNDNNEDNDNANDFYYYYPQWQTAPMSLYYQSTINSNYGTFDDFLNCTRISSTTQTACLGIAWSDSNSPGRITTMLYPIFNKFYNDTTTKSTSSTNDSDNTTATTTTTSSPRVVTAFLGVDIFWESYLEGILPSSMKNNKVYVVIQSTCHDEFTFTLIGNETYYAGDGDLHDPQFTSVCIKTRFGENLYMNQKQQYSEYTGTALYDDFCQYDFTIYPSSELYNLYVTNQPRNFSLLVAFMFFFTVMVFIVYERLVERRQRMVMKSAETSDAIVSSLFPANVKHRLYKEQNNINNNNSEYDEENNHPYDNHGGGTTTNLKDSSTSFSSVFGNLTKRKDSSCGAQTTTNSSSDFFPVPRRNSGGYNQKGGGGGNGNATGNGGTTTGTSLMGTTMDPSSTSHHHPYHSNSNHNDIVVDYSNSHHNNESLSGGGGGGTKAIAELHPDATVLFADIVGFTKWSSGRDPVDVFALLETLYGAFDAIAIRKKVFKIETIGDCYVAVTGLPEPQPDHALIMTRFANEMLNALQMKLKFISNRLGKEVLQLAMRVGMNSGPVIAGVLRGAKARFQLFGDTMNTAARMESNGERNRIHISQSTADLLTKYNKGHWLLKRDDMIEAKGKGMMQTYWVKTVKRSKKCTTPTSTRNDHSRGDGDKQSAVSCFSEESTSNSRGNCQQNLLDATENSSTTKGGTTTRTVEEDGGGGSLSLDESIRSCPPLTMCKETKEQETKEGQKEEEEEENEEIVVQFSRREDDFSVSIGGSSYGGGGCSRSQYGASSVDGTADDATASGGDRIVSVASLLPSSEQDNKKKLQQQNFTDEIIDKKLDSTTEVSADGTKIDDQSALCFL